MESTFKCATRSSSAGMLRSCAECRQHSAREAMPASVETRVMSGFGTFQCKKPSDRSCAKSIQAR